MKQFSLLFKYNLVLTIILFSAFLVLNTSYTVLGFILALLAAISSATLLYIILYIIFVLFSFIGKIGLYFIALGFVVVDLALLLDFFIFRLYNFHINAMVINILTNPASIDSIQIGIWPVLLIVSFILFLLFIQVSLIESIYKQDRYNLKRHNSSFNKLLIVPLFIIVFVEKFSYGFASLYSKSELLNAVRVIPLYQPLTFNKFAAKYFGFKFEESQENTISKGSPLNYPLNKIEFKEKVNKTNIFIIASDSISSSFINREISPNIDKFKNESLVFNNHYSGGNSTRFGIFSLLYGLNSTYWFSFLNSQKSTILFDTLKDLDYEVNVVSSTNASWPEFRKTAYVNIQDNLYDKFDGTPWEKDSQSSTKFKELISKMDTNKSQFSFLFLDAPHGYSYPKELNKFNAGNEEINYLTIQKGSPELKQVKATYKNAIYYNDKLFGEIVEELKKKGLYDNSIILFTSDHGKEFFEFGNLGHNTSFSYPQVKVPFILKLPKGEFREINKLSSHTDFVPTLMSYIGVKNPASDYSNGKNLLDKSFNRDYIFTANWNNNAIINSNYTYVFSNLPNKLFKNEIRDNIKYEKQSKDKRVNSKTLLSVINENKQFFK